jgi:DNA-binding CsgD family transcriptional regulator
VTVLCGPALFFFGESGLMLGAEPDAARPLVGRNVEIALIASRLDGVETNGAALVLRGEPGIGKSRLLEEAVVLARRRNMGVLTTTGVQSEARLPFAGLHQLLRPVRDRGARLPPALRVALDAAFGLAGDVPPEHFRVAMAVLELLSDFAAETPLLIVIEDAHWLDRASADVLAFVARRLESDPVVLLAASRDGYGDALGDAGLPQLRLGALDEAVAAELLDLSARRMPMLVRERLLQEAAGNPLALIELPLGSPDLQAEALAPGQLPLTERLERTFAARVSDLPDDTRLLVLVAALIDGEDVDEVLRAGSAVKGDQIDVEALEPAVAAAVIELDLQTVRFRHPLMRSAVRQAASVPERRRVHKALAQVLAAEPDRRVWHRAALMSGPHEDVATELEEAASSARRRGATGDAFTAMRRAAELSDHAQRARRLLASAQLAYEVGQPKTVLPLLREVEQLDPGPLDRARAISIEQMSSASPLDVVGRTALVAAAARADEAGDHELHVDLLWLLALRTWWAGTGSTVQDVLTQASTRLGGAEAPDPRVFAVYAYADAVGHTRPVLARLRAVLANGSCGTDAARYFGEAALVVGAFGLAMTFFREAVEGLRDDGRLGHLARTLSAYALVAAYLAEWDVAVPAAEESRRLCAEFKLPMGVARAETVTSMIAGMRGDVDTAERLSANAERVGLSAGFHAPITFAQFGRVAGQLGAGRHADAYTSAQRLFDPADPAHHPVLATWFIADLAEAALHIGRVEEATARLDQVEAAVGDTPAIWLALGLRHARAVLADSAQEAERHFNEALSADLSRWPFQRARILFAHGQWLRRQRRIAESRAPLRAARDAFDALGCTTCSDQARRELRASGESSRRRDPAARDQLTAQELQIAQLAAEGLSNREIGERLYLSPRTISTHLYRTFPKLGITARGQLGSALAPSTSSPEQPPA